MLAIFLAIVLALSAHLPTSAVAGGRVETSMSMPSEALGRRIAYAAYIPSVTPPNPARRLPVLYLLHGRGDNENAWLEHGNIAAILDRKIASGELQPLIVVMPMAANSWYVDDARTGPASYGAVARALTQDLVSAVDVRYPTAACREARAVGGLSMGGFGAMVYAFDHPDLYVAAFSLSGSLFSDRQDDIEARKSRYGQMFGGVYGEPFDQDRFRSWTVFNKLDHANPDIKKLSVWLAAGDEDFSAILSGTARLHQELVSRGISSELRIYDGDHTWRLWSTAVDPALSWLSARLDPSCPSTSRGALTVRAPAQPVTTGKQ